MTRLSTILVAMLTLLAANTVVTVAAAAEVVGSWRIDEQSDPEIKARCVMQQAAGRSKSIFAVVDAEGHVQLGLRDRTKFMLLPTEDPFIKLIFDGKPSKWRWSHLATPEIVLTDTPYQATEPDRLEAELRKADKIEARARGFIARITTSATSAALDALRRCETVATAETPGEEAEPTIGGVEDPPRDAVQSPPPASSAGAGKQAQNGATNAVGTRPKPVPVGDWQLMRLADWPPDKRPACVIFHRSEKLSVFAAVAKDGSTFFGVRLATVKLTPAMFLDGSANLWFDTEEAVVVDASRFDKLDSVVVSGRGRADGIDPIMTLFARSSRITVRAPGIEVTIAPAETAKAASAVKNCIATLPDPEPVIRGPGMAVGDGEPMPGDEGAEEAHGDPAIPASPPSAGNEAQRLGQALGGLSGSSPTLAEYRCSVSDSQLYGIATANGDSGGGPMTLGIASDGTGVINGNGQRLQPAYTDGGGAGGELRSVAYRVVDIFRAIAPSPDAGLPFAGNAQGGIGDYQAALVMGRILGQGMALQLMGNRQRYLTVSLADDTVRFLDLTPENQAANVAALDCVRTK